MGSAGVSAGPAEHTEPCCFKAQPQGLPHLPARLRPAPCHCARHPPHVSRPLLSWTLSPVICDPGTGPRLSAAFAGCSHG